MTKARTTGSPTPRERALIDAVAILFSSTDPGTHRKRDRQLRSGDEGDRRRAIRTTPRCRIFYALAVTQSASPTDKTYAKQTAGGRRFSSRCSSRCRSIPGSRTTSFTPTTRRRWRPRRSTPPAATRRSRPRFRTRSTCRRTPSRASARGRNRSTPIANRPTPRASRAGRPVPAKSCTRSITRSTPIFRSAQDKAAKAVLDHALAVVGGADGVAAGAAGAGAYALAAIPARYALERGAWAEAAALTLRPANTPYTEAITHFARAIGAARSGQPGGGHAPTSRASRSCARSCGRCRTRTGPSRSTFSDASRSRGRRLRKGRRTTASRS